MDLYKGFKEINKDHLSEINLIRETKVKGSLANYEFSVLTWLSHSSGYEISNTGTGSYHREKQRIRRMKQKRLMLIK